MNHFYGIARTLQGLSIFGALFVMLQPILVVIAVAINTNEISLGIITFKTSADTTWWKAFLTLIPNAIVAWGLIQLSQFGRLLAKGKRFTSEVSNSLKKASILFVVGVIISWLVEPFLTALSFAAAFVQLLENHGLLLLISIAFSLVAVLLNQAKEIEAENKEFY